MVYSDFEPPAGAEVEATDEPDEHAGDGKSEWHLVVKFAVPTDDFLLTSMLAVGPDAVVELEQFVPTNHDLLPYL